MINCRTIIIVFMLFSAIIYGKSKPCSFTSKDDYSKTKDTLPTKKVLSNIAPILTATGNQIYCPLTPINIVTDFTIVDPDDTGINAMYIQISSGYILGQDILSLAGSHPTILSAWNPTTGKLSLTGASGQPTYIDLVAAVKDIQFYNNSSSPTGNRTFSITISQANYLPSNGHYYEYIPNIGITWTSAKAAAQTNSYYGLQGYLATITAADEAQLAGAQAAGAGWIGGSDEQVEGLWKWMTGPEAGSNMVFTFWNNGEPNNLNEEDYAHITAPGVGIPGSWNDLSNTGDTSGPYQPKGYIVEYGGMPGDPVLHISTSSSITIPTITATVTSSSCGPGSVTLQATSSTGTINWYSDATNGLPIGTGNSFTTPLLTTTTTYYVDAFSTGCFTGTRTPVVATINEIPVVTVITPSPICGNNTTTISASTTAGIINWFTTATGGSAIASGTSFTTPNLIQQTVYYAEGNNNGCLSLTRVPVTVFVYPLPNVTDEQLILCQNETITLDAGLSNQTYLWSTTETSQTITVSSPGTYTVVVTSLPPESCSKTKTITVVQHTAPIIQEVIVSGITATIITTGVGDYEYSIDGVNYQDSNVLNLTDGGLYTAFVREKHNCGNDYQTFVIIKIPKYFTPNNDGYNDSWSIEGLIYYPEAEVKIFDRYGKLITVLNPSNYSWDGTLNSKQLPSDDYWFVFKIDANHSEIKGHFAMKR